MRDMYPDIEPFEDGFLEVSDLHEIYYEVCGNPEGKSVVVCHGGPGYGATPEMRRSFDPEAYKVILFDQRGCGRSKPHAELRDNTTWRTIEDMEQLRVHLAVERWQVFGGSWGSTLAIAYAQAHPTHVSELVVRGVFTLREEELRWLYQDGANRVFPEYWEEFVALIPEHERDDVIGAYYKRLMSDDRETQIAAAQAWSKWEGAIVTLLPSPDTVAHFLEPMQALALARIEAHYFVNNCFFDEQTNVLNNLDTLACIPGTIVQGRYDMVTPLRSAWELHKAWPGSELIVVHDGGHASSEPGIASALIAATDKYRESL